MGIHLAAYLLANTDARITLFNDLSEPGADHNLAWLRGQAEPGRFTTVRGDLRNPALVAYAAATASEIYHLVRNCDDAPQGFHDSATACTSSLLDAAIHSGRSPAVIYASTGNPETVRCSGAEQLVLDYARVHHLPATVLRIDTVTGPRQFEEGQDWVARMVYAVLSGRVLNLPSASSEPHHVLHVADAVQAVLAARAYAGITAGNSYSVAGGRAHSITVHHMIRLVERICHRKARLGGPGGLPADVSPAVADDVSFTTDTCWRPRRSLEETLRDIVAFWHASHQGLSTARSYSEPDRMPQVRAA